MTLATIYGMSPININSTVLPIDNLTLPAGVMSKAIMHSGNEYPSLSATPGATPRATFKTPFAGAYTLFGLTAFAVTAFDVYFALFSSFIRASGAVHPKMSLASSAQCYAQIMGWSCAQDGLLMADVELTYLAPDSVTYPVAAVTTAALPQLAAQPQLHTLGPLLINGTAIAGLDRSSGTMNHTAFIPRTDGDLYPKIAAKLQSAPRLSMDHGDPLAVLAALGGSPGGYIGAAITGTVVQYFRAYSLSTGLVSASPAVSITVASGRVNVGQTGASQGSMAKKSLQVECLQMSPTSPSTNPLAINLMDTAPTL